jgi:hypothetical protein
MAFDGPSFIQHVAKRLIQEFQFSQGAGTPGLIGAAKEHPARIQLEQLMPAGVSIGSGIIVDSYGGVSRQQDIVIYENLCPVFTHNGTAEATYYPVEGVIAVGEVKSGLGKSELLDAITKSKSVKVLRRRAEVSDDGLGLPPAVSYRKFGDGGSYSAVIDDQFDQDKNSLDQVFSFVLCQRFVATPETTLKNFSEECRKASRALMPNMIASLADGIIHPYNSKSGSITRSVMEGDAAIFTQDGVAGFAQLLRMLRLYVMGARTVERKHFERYFHPIGSGVPMLTIDARENF